MLTLLLVLFIIALITGVIKISWEVDEETENLEITIQFDFDKFK